MLKNNRTREYKLNHVRGVFNSNYAIYINYCRQINNNNNNRS